MTLEDSIEKTTQKVSKWVKKTLKTIPKPPKDFESHLNAISKASKQTKTIKKRWKSSVKIAESTLKILWEQIFDFLCLNPSATLTDLNKIAAIVQKTTACFSQIKSLDPKAPKNPPTDQPITQNLIQQIETELNLL